MRVVVTAIVALILLLTLTVAGVAQSDEDNIVSTSHQVMVNGRLLRYTARAGRLPILDNETGEVHGRMFFISYTLIPTPGTKPRPLAFIWNGGPGSSSSLVHLLGFGPRSLQPDGKAVDNPDTWLDQADLVFVDPVGTGYSRPAKAEYGPEFYQTKGDAESVAEFIRVYRNRFETWDSPVFLAGESYGVTRAAGVADVLQRRGITVSGVILMGSTLPLGQLSAETRAALSVTTLTAAAFANKKLAPELQVDLRNTLRQAEDWGESEYAAALSRRDSLNNSERQTLLARLARFTGLDPSKLDPKTLTINTEQFSLQLLAEQNQVVGRYDSRLVGRRDPNEQQYDPTKDPSLKNIINDVGILRYFSNELHYKSDLQYQGPFGGGYPPATTFRGDWMSVKWSRASAQATPSATPSPASGAPSTAVPEQPLRRAMTANPKLQVLVACGYYDLVCSYRANFYLATHLEPALSRNVFPRAYAGGHAIYTDATARSELKRDVAKFMNDSVSQTSRP